VSADEKLVVKVQVRISEEEKKNLDSNISMLAKQVRDQTGRMITCSDFLRLVLEDLRQKNSQSVPIIWPPRLEASKKQGTRTKRRR
jgi:hypothetical protein